MLQRLGTKWVEEGFKAEPARPLMSIALCTTPLRMQPTHTLITFSAGELTHESGLCEN